MNLKKKTIFGLFWSFFDSFSSQGIQFVVGVILARILSPREFGLIGMISIFIAISQTFIDSGFSIALIRKQNCTHDDYSTTFYFNNVVSIFFYVLLLMFSGIISNFYDEPQLKLLIKVLGIGLLFNSLSIIQKTILIKELNFKLQMKVSFLSSLCSGVIAIILSLRGYGVWSLVILTLSKFGLSTILLWIWAKWRPNLRFSKKSFNELFSFGSKLLLSGLLDTTFRNIYNLLIGKYFSANELGYYTQADQLQTLPSQSFMGVITKVSFPVLSSIQNDSARLKIAYQRLIKSTMFVTFILMLGLAAISNPLILTLIGEKWTPSIIYLQMLCFVGIFYPLHALNLNMLQVQGRSDLFLRLEIIKKTLAIPTIIIGIFFGIKVMIIGMIVNNVISYYLNSFWSGKLIGYSFFNQVKDILPSFVFALIISGVVYTLSLFIDFQPLFQLLTLITIGIFLTILLGEVLKIKEYILIKEPLIDTLRIIKSHGKN